MGYDLMDTDAKVGSIRSNAGNTETYPYRANADIPDGPKILLNPGARQPAASATPPDPSITKLAAIDRSLRLIAAPWIIQPPDSESFHLASGIAIPAVDGAFHAVDTVIVPPGRNGVLNRIANTIVGGAFSDFSGDLIWMIVRNPGAAITAAERNYNNITASLGAIAAPAKIAGIRIFENDVVQLVVKNVGIAPSGEFIGGLLGGWFYPRTWDDQFERQDQSVSW